MTIVIIRSSGKAVHFAADAVDNSETAATVSCVFDFFAGSFPGDDVAGFVIAVVINPGVAIGCGCERQEM